jgi:hypothetical protein
VFDSNTYLPARGVVWPASFLGLNIMIWAGVVYSTFEAASFFINWLKINSYGLLALYTAMVATLVVGNISNWRIKALVVFRDWSSLFAAARIVVRALAGKSYARTHATDSRCVQMPACPTEREALCLNICRNQSDDLELTSARDRFLMAQELSWLAFVLMLFLGLGVLMTGVFGLQVLAYLVFLLLQYIVASAVAQFTGNRFFMDVLPTPQMPESA